MSVCAYACAFVCVCVRASDMFVTKLEVVCSEGDTEYVESWRGGMQGGEGG